MYGLQSSQVGSSTLSRIKIESFSNSLRMVKCTSRKTCRICTYGGAVGCTRQLVVSRRSCKAFDNHGSKLLPGMPIVELLMSCPCSLDQVSSSSCDEDHALNVRSAEGLELPTFRQSCTCRGSEHILPCSAFGDQRPRRLFLRFGLAKGGTQDSEDVNTVKQG